jgi:RNA polymerase sigma-70 factor (ECF subfamily)
MTSFLYPVVKNLSIAARRKTGRFASGGQAIAHVQSPEPNSRARAELSAALASMAEPHREVLLLRFVDDLSLQEISDSLGVPLGTVKSRLHHAIAALRANPRLTELFL